MSLQNVPSYVDVGRWYKVLDVRYDLEAESQPLGRVSGP